MLVNANNLKGVLAVVAASFLWGTTGIMATFTTNVSSLAIGAFAMGVAGVLLVLINFSYLAQNYRLILKQKMLYSLGVLSVTVYPLAFYSSMRISGVAIGTIASLATAPIFAAIIECLFSQKVISKQWVISFAFGAIGIILLTAGKENTLSSTANTYQHTVGVVLGCIAGITYACYSWIARALIDKGVHPRSALSGLFGGAAILLLPSLWFTGDNLFSNKTNGFVSLYMAIVPMCLGYLLFSYALKFIDTSRATVITLLEPLIATILAVFLLGESFQVTGWLGGLLVFLCLIIQSVKLNFSFNLFKSNKYNL
ncbi:MULTISPECIES: DMT family transporter [Shewanella]|uniref:DMT family transporter n=1 Tax=Shewanella TaxID=22 RepID=UPI003AAE4215